MIKFYDHEPAPHSAECRKNCRGCREKVRDTMMLFDLQENAWRKATRSAQAGNNRITVRETVRLLERGTLRLNNDLVI